MRKEDILIYICTYSTQAPIYSNAKLYERDLNIISSFFVLYKKINVCS